MNQQFKLILNLTKGYKSEDGRLFVEGIASGTDLDLTGERMSPEAIKSMAASLQKGIVELRSEHSPNWDDLFGEVVELNVTPDNQLHYKAELDPGFSKSHDLLHALAKGKKLGVSIGGQVVKAGMEWVEELQRSVYTYFDIALKEISVTAQPAYAQAWVSQITKSISREEVTVSMPEVTKNDEAVEEVVAASAEQAPVTAPAEQAPAAEHAAPETESPEVPATEATVAEEEQETPAESTDVEEAPETAAESTENAATDAEQEQEAEAPEAASHPESSPEGDDKPLDETQKSQYLGEYAEADASCSVICNLSDELSWSVWGVIASENVDAATKAQTVDAMLTEFHAIVMRVAAALIAQESISDAAEMGKTLQTKRTDLSKSLTAKTEELDAVIKSLAAATKQVTESQAYAEALQKSVEEKDAAIAAVKEELATAQKTIADAEAKAKIVEARKAYQVTSKFDLAINLKEDKQPDQQEVAREFAGFFAGAGSRK